MAAKKAKPDYEAYLVDGEGDKAFWTKVGAAWKHDDTEGLNIVFTPGLAVSGKIVLRKPNPRARPAAV